MNTSYVYAGITIAIVIAIVGCFLPVLPKGKSVFGSVDTTCQGWTTCLSDLYLTTTGGGTGSLQTAGTVTIGASGTALTNIIATTCTGIVYAALAATTTRPIDCAVTGALTSAKFVGFGTPAGMQTGNLGLIISGGHASSTTGYVTGYISNFGANSTSSYPLATTSIPVIVVQ